MGVPPGMGVAPGMGVTLGMGAPRGKGVSPGIYPVFSTRKFSEASCLIMFVYEFHRKYVEGKSLINVSEWR